MATPEIAALPVDVLRPEVERELARRPLVIAAPTGSGKSTRVPLWCQAQIGGSVLVVEPRRVACRSLARYVAAQLGEPLGETVGYTVRFEDVTSPRTRVRFVTPGIALQLASGDERPTTNDQRPTLATGRSTSDDTNGLAPSSCSPDEQSEPVGPSSLVVGRSSSVGAGLGAYSVFILDEFHERGIETDLFLAVVRRHRPDAALVLMSATVEAEPLAAFLGGTALRATGRLYPVAVRYLGGPMVPAPDRLEERVLEAVRRALRETEGSVLVFLPGKGEIARCRDRLGRLPEIEVLPLHGTLPNAEIDRVFEPGGRRVILATNVAETSVTVPGITAVVDSGLARQRLHRARRSVLATVAVSHAAAEQRRGRAGRLSPGVCYRLWDERGRLEPETPPEIRREPLTQFLLAVAATGCHVEELQFLDTPPPFALAEAAGQLDLWGAITPDGHLTSFGRRLSQLPVDPTYARLLAEASLENTSPLPDLCDLVAALEVRAPLLRSLEGLDVARREEVVAAREAELWPLRCDATALILTLRHGDVARHHLHPTALTEARRIAVQLRELVGVDERPTTNDQRPTTNDEDAEQDASSVIRHPSSVRSGPDASRRTDDASSSLGSGRSSVVGRRSPLVGRRSALIALLLHHWPDAAYVRRRKGDAWANGEDEVVLSRDSLVEREVEAAVILEKENMAVGGARVRAHARVAMPCRFADLLRAGLGTPQAETPVREDGRWVAEVAVTYAGREIGRERRPLEGALLRHALAGRIVAGKLFPGLAEQIRERIGAYTLREALRGEGCWGVEVLGCWGRAPTPTPTPTRNPVLRVGVGVRVGVADEAVPPNTSTPQHLNTQAWLESRLTTLGVEAPEDWLLLEPEDLRFDGIDDAEVAELKARYPRSFSFGNAVFAVDYDPAARLVTLTWASGFRRVSIPGHALPRWHGWRVRVVEKGETTTLR